MARIFATEVSRTDALYRRCSSSNSATARCRSEASPDSYASSFRSVARSSSIAASRAGELSVLVGS
jgi:hypothetical protein